MVDCRTCNVLKPIGTCCCALQIDFLSFCRWIIANLFKLFPLQSENYYLSPIFDTMVNAYPDQMGLIDASIPTDGVCMTTFVT